MNQDIEVTIKDAPIRRRLRNVPKFVNTSMNRALASVGGKFSGAFSRQAFGAGKINIQAGGAKKKKAKGGISIPVKMRNAGFKGELRRRDRLDGKRSSIRTSSPLMSSFEFGATITPRRGRFLYIPVKTAKEKRAAVRSGAATQKQKTPFVLAVRRVVIRRRLGFFSTWRAMRQVNFDGIRKGFDDGIRRAALSAEKFDAKAGG
jgi:hypothetical protein